MPTQTRTLLCHSGTVLSAFWQHPGNKRTKHLTLPFSGLIQQSAQTNDAL